MTTARPLTAIAAAATALLSAGCGALNDPYTDTPHRPADGATAAPATGPASGTQAPDDLVNARPVQTPAPAGARLAQSARQAAARYATVYSNWTWRTYARQQRQLVALTTGTLRRELTRSTPGRDQLGVLDAQKQTNRGRVLSLGVPAAATRRRGGGEDLFVLTLEQAGSGDFQDPNQRHAAYKATVQETPDGWLVSAWSALP